jgi:hypothetical protein
MVRPSALFLSPRLNEQLVDQKRVGVLQMIDESSPVLAQYFRQDAGVNDLLVQHIKQRKEACAPVFPGAYGANVNFDSYVLDATFAKVSSELPADKGVSTRGQLDNPGNRIHRSES